MRTVGVLSWIVLVAASLLAQSPAGGFETASVKPAEASRPFSDFTGHPPPGSWRAFSSTLQNVIALAHPQFTTPGLIEGGPGWVRDTRFDIEARMDPATTPTQLQSMIRRLLDDRFALRTHVEQRTLDVFVLTLAQPGTLGRGMTRALPLCANAREQRLPFPDECAISVSHEWTRVLTSPAETLAELSVGLTIPPRDVGRPVVDRTGLEGYFRLSVLGRPGEVVSMSTAILEQLGLKLTPAREPVDVMVIDSAALPEPD